MEISKRTSGGCQSGVSGYEYIDAQEKEAWRADAEAERVRRRHMRRPFEVPAGEVLRQFSSSLEERKVLEYVRNIIFSRLMRGREPSVINLCSEVLGRRVVADAALRRKPELAADEGFTTWTDRDAGEHGLHGDLATTILREEIAPRIERQLARLSGRTGRGIDARLGHLQRTFSLSDAEMELVAFSLLWKTTDVMSDYFNGSMAGILDLSDLMKLRSFGGVVLGVPRAAFLKVFESGLVFHAGIIERNRSINGDLADWCTDYLCGIGRADLQGEYFTLENDEPLEAADFDLTEDELLVIDGLLKGRAGRNLLFYGTPGTGKTSFARSLAKHYGKKLFSVKVPDGDSVKDRLRAVIAAVNLAGATDSIVLVDEADGLLNTGFLFRGVEAASKSWINTFLDSHNKKVIWISNRSQDIDPSTMRRFSLTLEFRPFDPVKRLKVLRHALAAKGVGPDYFTEEDLQALCRDFSVNAAGIVSAIGAVAMDRRTRKALTLRKIRAILKNHEKAIGGAGTARREKTFDQYALDGLNASLDLAGIVGAVKRAAAGGDEERRPISMLLYGMPGTGKSEFVYYLGHTLGREVLLKRASDIQSMFIGQTEKNIAEAFREARERGVVLFFDEADTFLFPRAGATHSWEKSHTNEILTQLESHRGVVVFATNDIDGLDHAALRRFGFKVRFDPLNPAGNVRFYESLLAPMMADGLVMTADEQKRLMGIGNLTPGDFAVVRSQIALLGTEGLDHGKLLDSLESEVRYKKSGGKAIGF